MTDDAARLPRRQYAAASQPPRGVRGRQQH
jgi:hypothetical protein